MEFTPGTRVRVFNMADQFINFKITAGRCDIPDGASARVIKHPNESCSDIVFILLDEERYRSTSHFCCGWFWKVCDLRLAVSDKYKIV